MRIMLVIGSLLIAISSLAQTCQEELANATVTYDKQSIEVDYGQIDRGDNILLCLKVKNVGPEEVHIFHIQPSIGDPCISRNAINLKLLPSQEAVFTICLHTNRDIGTVEKKFEIMCMPASTLFVLVSMASAN